MSRLPDDQNYTDRILTDNGIQRGIEKRNIWSLLIFHPLLQIILDENNIIHAPARFSDVSFKAWLSKIPLAGFLDSRNVVLDSARRKSLMMGLKRF